MKMFRFLQTAMKLHALVAISLPCAGAPIAAPGGSDVELDDDVVSLVVESDRMRLGRSGQQHQRSDRECQGKHPLVQ